MLELVVKVSSLLVHDTMRTGAVFKTVPFAVPPWAASLVCAVEVWGRVFFPNAGWKNFAVRLAVLEYALLFCVVIFYQI